MARIAGEGPDILEAGQGPLVVLVHSSVSGARQWHRLIDRLAPRFHVKAVNLYGYGGTPPWTGGRPERLEDQADLVARALNGTRGPISLIGHSLGGSIAMKAALRLGSRIGRLALLEPNAFFLLRDAGRHAAYGEVLALRRVVLEQGARDGDWPGAAAYFADYWGGLGTWEATSPKRRAAFIEALKPNVHEWDAVLGERTPLESYAADLPADTLVLHDPATVRPIREIVALLQAHTPWRFETLPEGGHMAPLTHPDVVNPVLEQFLIE
ncbi:MAG: alpha/beta hydrolase [Pseudomonadota bacterium]